MSTNLEEMEAGMVDGVKDPSRKWNSYWRECGVCNPDFQPQYIIHLEHYRKDLRVLYMILVLIFKLGIIFIALIISILIINNHLH